MTRTPTPDPLSAGSDDHWQVLGLSPGADAASLKRAFRLQARRWHPDLNDNDPVAEERFKRVNEAYAVLSDPMRRRTWEAGEEAGAGGGDADPFATGFPSFETYLEALFGERRSRRRWDDDAPEPEGVDGDAAASEAGSFDTDNLDAVSSDSGPERSEVGGRVTPAQASPPPVQAAGQEETLVDLTPEQALVGERVELELAGGTVVEVWTPPLAGDGWRLRLAGVAPGGGDHFLQLRVRTAEGLRIDGLRVKYPLELSPAEAALGTQVVVPTLEGPVRLRVPPGSSSGRLLRLRGRGQLLGERRGDQLVEVRIVIDDEELSEAERALYGRLRELEEERREAAGGG